MREKEKERNINQLSSTGAPARDWTWNTGVRPDWELNRRPFSLQDNTEPTEPHQPGFPRTFYPKFQELPVLTLQFLKKHCSPSKLDTIPTAGKESQRMCCIRQDLKHLDMYFWLKMRRKKTLLTENFPAGCSHPAPWRQWPQRAKQANTLYLNSESCWSKPEKTWKPVSG